MFGLKSLSLVLTITCVLFAPLGRAVVVPAEGAVAEEGAVATEEAAAPDEARMCPPEEGKAASLCPHAAAAARRLHAAARPEAPLEAGDPNIDVQHYFLDIEIIPEYSGPSVIGVRVEGTCTITASPVADGLTACGLDLRTGMNVSSVTGDVGSWARGPDRINVNLDRAYNAAETFDVTVDYDGYPDPSGFGAFSWWMRNGELVVATLSEPYYANFWWPCKDALDDKATMEMHVTVPGPMVAVSNGQTLGTTALPGGRIKYLWQETYPMITYLASLAITTYERYDLEFPYEDNGPQIMPVPCYVYPDHWDFGAGEPEPAEKAGCDELPVMLETLGQRFGLYPFVNEKYGVVETGGTGGLGASMEHQTISSMYRVANFSDIMAHELAHQWWGDEVTCQTWYDIWANEGFASYAEALYREIKPGGGIGSYWTRINSRRPSNPDGRVYRTSIDSEWDIFDGNDVYNKGAWVLHMLRHVMGDEAFFDGLAYYRDTFRYDSVTTEEFTAAMSSSFGHDLSWFTDEWVMSFGSPDYEWNYAYEAIGGAHYLKLRIEQTQNQEGYGLFTMPIDIRVSTAFGPTVHKVWNDGWSEYYVIAIDGPPTNVEFDEDGGDSGRGWVLWDTRTRVVSPVLAPPVLVQADIDVFAGTEGETIVQLVFSEDIGSFDETDISLAGENTGTQTPSSITYTPTGRSALIVYTDLPDDNYTLTVFASGVTANGKSLDGEISDADWWDDVLLPSGDGRPGGNAVLPFSVLHGDGDQDDDVDLTDYAGHYGCVTGPDNAPYAAGCGAFDFDADRDIDMVDFGAFQRAFTGE